METCVKRVHEDWTTLPQLAGLQFNKLQPLLSYGKNTADGKFIGVRYFDVCDATKRAFMQLVPSKYRPWVTITYMEITSPYVPPHTDNCSRFSWNFYINTCDATTSFWAVSDAATTPVAFGKDGQLFQDEVKLKRIGQFKAMAHESWILNVNTIHSVNSALPGTRTAFVISSHHTFQDFSTLL